MIRGPEICRRAGITYRQLDYWARSGVLTPSIVDAHGKGTQRLYSDRDLEIAIVLGFVTSHGLRVNSTRVRDIARHVSANGLTGCLDLDGFRVVVLDLDNFARARELVAS